MKEMGVQPIHAVFVLVVVVIVALAATESLSNPPTITTLPPQCRTPTACITMSYEPCIRGYSGFQVARQYPNPSTWTFELAKGSTGYLIYENNVTKGLDIFLRGLSESWTISQTYGNGSSLLVEVSGTTIVHVQYDVLNEFPVVRPNGTYVLGISLSPSKYVINQNIVNVTWSITGIIPGTYQIQAIDLDWHTIEVVSGGVPVNSTSESFGGTCGPSGTSSLQE